jgi:hypothetical protein
LKACAHTDDSLRKTSLDDKLEQVTNIPLPVVAKAIEPEEKPSI